MHKLIHVRTRTFIQTKLKFSILHNQPESTCLYEGTGVVWQERNLTEVPLTKEGDDEEESESKEEEEEE